jgi:hypothetical protein
MLDAILPLITDLLWAAAAAMLTYMINKIQSQFQTF